MTKKEKQIKAGEILESAFGIRNKRELIERAKENGQVFDKYEFELYGDEDDFQITFDEFNNIVSIEKQSKEWVNIFNNDEE